ncbi:hypothetical protein [Hymenobacter saemangeumensis]|uniref:hypothetical protein n=1 Tax=Hymenobacter saemangeumensis TaxID=1084522 RepID=UPI0031EA7AF5
MNTHTFTRTKGKMNLYNQAENEALGDELVLLTDKWPDCDQERAIELQEAFDEFSRQGGWHFPEVAEIRSRSGLIYVIKRNPERAARYIAAHITISAEAASRRKKRTEGLGQ